MGGKNMTLEDWRDQIDELDLQIINLLAKRMEKVCEIGKLKKDAQLPIHNYRRQQKVMKYWMNQAEKNQLSTDFIRRIYEVVHEHALELEVNS
jgi:chorismate mutase